MPDKKVDVSYLLAWEEIDILALQETRKSSIDWRINIHVYILSVESPASLDCAKNGLASRKGEVPGRNGFATLIRDRC